MKKNFLLLALLLCSLSFTKAQVLDDSTKNVYGPTTTHYLYENDIRLNKIRYEQIDTSSLGFYRFTLLDKNENKYQNLGNLGTAVRPIFYEPPTQIGARPGFDAYSVYFVDPQKIKYYDTKSPFTSLYLIFGGSGRAIVDVNHTRNITPLWNVGADFRRITADKQVARQTRGDRNVVSTAYDLYTRFRTKDSTYQILANFTRIRHRGLESGGILPNNRSPQDSILSLFTPRNASVRLSDAEGVDERVNFHIYHQYQLSELAQVYHIFDNYTQKNFYTDPLSESDISYYGNAFILTDTTREKSTFKYFQNEAGLKGNINNFFYNFYFKRRDLKFIYKYLDPVGFKSENTVGFILDYDLAKGSFLDIAGEYLLGGNYKLSAEFRNKFFNASFKRVRYEPSLIEKAYFGNHDEWYNDFEPVLFDNVNGFIRLKLSFLELQPTLSLSNVYKYVYWDTNAEPAQTKGAAQILSPGVKLNLKFLKHIYLNNSVIYTKVTGAAEDVFRIPEIFVNSSLYYHNILFEGRLEAQIGIDVHYKSDYKALSYDPVLQQYYLQDFFNIPAYPVADFFANLKIGRVRVFGKMTHINQGMVDLGYLTTPYYLGQPRVFDVGMNWMFFD